jgi:hypothetical protein
MWNALSHTRNLIRGTRGPSALPVIFPPKNSCWLVNLKRAIFFKKMGISGVGDVCILRTGSHQSSPVANLTAS